VLQLFGYNVEEVPHEDLFRPLAFSVGTAVMGCVLLWHVLRSLARSAIVTSVMIPLLMFFEPIRHFITGLIPLLGRPDVFAGLIAVLCLALVLRLRRVEGSALESLTRGLNVFALAIVCVALFPIIRFYAWDGRGGSDPGIAIPSRFGIESWSCQVGYCPDIYYLVLDGYGRADALQAAYDIQNDAFLNALQRDGFLVARRSSSNYSNTLPSLRSALNMDYEHAPQEETASFRIDINLVALALRKLGYEYVLVPSGLAPTSRSPLADVTVDAGAIQSEFAALTLERSVVGAIVQSSRQQANQLLNRGVVESLDGALQWRRHIEQSFQSIGAMPAGDRPKFVFAHIVSPHPPYVFDSSGNLPSDSQMTDLSDLEGDDIWDSPNFAGQLSYLNRMVLDVVTRIQARAARPPIIIIHGDHGTYRFGESESRANPSDRLLAERMSILFAVLAPPEITEQFYDAITPVNVFRVLFRGLFGAPLSLLDDRNYWSFVDPPREVSDVVQTFEFGSK
jgi:hypothetical protein